MMLYIWFAVMMQAFMPGGDRIVNCLDPQGAAFSLHAKKTA